MAATFRAGNGAESGSVASQVIAKPTGTVAGEVMFGFTIADDQAPTTVSGTWTQLGTTGTVTEITGMKNWQRVAGASEPSSYTFSYGSGADVAAGIITVTGADSTTPLVATPPATSTGTGTSMAAPSVTGVVGGLLVCVWYRRGDNTAGATRAITAPGTMVKRIDTQGSWATFAVATQELTATGATGTRTATFPISTGWRAYSFVVAPAVTAPAVGTAAGTWAFSGAATATRAPKASAGGAWVFGGAAVGTAPVAPATVLNIGPGAGQNHFSVQVAPDGGSVETHSQAEIAAGYSDPVHFHTTPDGWVRFQPSAAGPTTAGSAYARDELREADAAGGDIAFNALVGEHIMQGRTRINHVPTNDADVAIAQLHNGDSDRIAIRTQMFSNGTVVLGVRINGTLHATRLQNPWVPGSDFTWKIRISSGTAEVYYNNMTTPVITSTALVQTTNPAGWYFKAGAYNQFNTTETGATSLTVPADEYSQVDLRELSVSHTAPVAPVVGTAGGTWAFGGAATGKRPAAANASGAWTFGGAAAGKRPARSAASGTWTFAGTAVGRKSPKATATGAWTFVGAAVGKRPARAAASGAWSFVGAASGRPVAKATAAGIWTFAGSAAIGKRSARAVVAGMWSFLGNAAGRRRPLAQAAGVTAWAGSATGAAREHLGHTYVEAVLQGDIAAAILTPAAATATLATAAASAELAETVATAALTPALDTATLAGGSSQAALAASAATAALQTTT